MKFIKWLIMNGTLIVLFVLGNIGAISVGYLNIVVFVYWLYSLLMLMLFSNEVAKRAYEQDKNWKKAFNSKFAWFYDMIVVSIMVYFGYIFLPICYILAAFALNTFAENYIKLKKEDNERV